MDSNGTTCVESCPVGMYHFPSTTECVPCHELCDPYAGCAGPLPYIDSKNGCRHCSLVELTRSGVKVYIDYVYEA